MAENLRTRTRRRRFGVICLALAILMLLAGETLLKSQLAGVGLIVYWIVCLVLTALAAGAAIVDAARVGRESREAQRSLLETTLREVEREREARRNDKR
jgi:hypothetical protein